MIDDAWRNPSRAERVAEQVAALFIPGLLVLAAGTLFSWWLLGDLGQGLLSALSILVVACPCTIGIATPLATSLAIARAARAGIVVRGGRVREEIAALDLIFFDKTGTLTTGQPVLQEIQPRDPALELGELLGRLAALESSGGHILGKSVAAAALMRGCEPGSVSGVRVHPGRGLQGAVTWRGSTKEVSAGSGSFIRGLLAPPLPDAQSASSLPKELAAAPKPEDLSRDGSHSVIEVAWEGALRGRLLFADELRPEARRCIATLEEYGIASVLLSGDRLPAASAVAAATGIPRVEAPRTPAQKLQAIADSTSRGRRVAMVGDGINDAPALAAARTGIAFGAGTDLARQAGNVVVRSGRLMLLPWLIGLSRRTASTIRGNFAWSFGYNALALGAAAAGMLHPLLAALAMVVSSLTVLGNSLRITGYPDRAAPRQP